MWRAFADWLIATIGMAREVQEHRDSLRKLEVRVRDLEEILKLTIQEARHARELEKFEREKLLKELERATLAKSLPSTKRRGRKRDS